MTLSVALVRLKPRIASWTKPAVGAAAGTGGDVGLVYVPEKPRPIEDLAAEVAKLKGAGERREEIFRKQFEAEKSHGKVLEKKFDELFKRAMENPDAPPPKRDIDFD